MVKEVKNKLVCVCVFLPSPLVDEQANLLEIIFDPFDVMLKIFRSLEIRESILIDNSFVEIDLTSIDESL